MKKYEFFAELADKPANKWTDKQKELTRDEAAKKGIRINEGCPDCYRDAAAQLAILLRPAEKGASAGGYELRPGLDITLHSYKHGVFRVCAATLTEENARKWLAAGLPERFFVKMPKE